MAIARALANDPELILADEPTASLDADSGQRAMEVLRTISSKNRKTLLVVTHDSRIYPFADRLYTVENGNLVVGNDTPRAASSPAVVLAGLDLSRQACFPAESETLN